MKVNIYLLRYNNYYNKIIKKSETLNQYFQYVIGDPLFEITNFNFGNGITTKYVLSEWNILNGIPDYILLCDSNTNEIISRWFIDDATYTRNGQYILTLYRDLIADNFEKFLDSTAYIYNGYVYNNNPLIFNNENVEFNQIKTKEILLTPYIKCPWLVAYLSRYNGDGTFNNFQGSFNTYEEDSYNYQLNNLNEYLYFDYINTQYSYIKDSDLKFCTKIKNPNLINEFTTDLSLTNTGWEQSITLPLTGGNYPYGVPSLPSNYKILYNNTINSYNLASNNRINSYTNLGYSLFAQSLLAEKNKIILSNGKYYKINVIENKSYIDNIEDINAGKIIINNNTNLYNSIVDNILIANNITITNTIENTLVYSTYYNIKLTLEELEKSPSSKKYNIQFNKIITKDAPYEIIAAPYITNNLFNTLNHAAFNQNKELVMQWFQDLASKNQSSGKLYDIQLLPYSPFINNALGDVPYYELKDEENKQLAFAVSIPTASFSLIFNNKMLYDWLDEIPIRNDNKVAVNCDLYRLVSPNGVGEYEFSIAKNGGIQGFEVDCTLIPLNPYIKVNPIFNNLYGGDFNDYRGLILGGDYSLPIVSDQWANYQLNNKYYQEIFDRNIESQEFNNKYAKLQDIINATTGTISGATQGGITGATVGGPAGAIAGAIMGGISSSVGGAADIIINDRIREEAIDRQKDIFSLNLKTIQARPNTLTRTTAYNINNKYFPYIEYYTCTDEELEAFNNLIKFRGMSINKIGKIRDYISNNGGFISGNIIYSEITNDSHVIQIINEIFKGGIRLEL